jgi:hypothetical protein
MKQLRRARGGDKTSEQKNNAGSSNTKAVAVRLTTSINNVRTLPKARYKGTDALKLSEGFKKEENKRR